MTSDALTLAVPPAAPMAATPAPDKPAFDYAASRPRFGVPRDVLWSLAMLTLAVAAVFADTLRLMYGRWVGPIGYYSHGPLVVPIAVVTAWLIIRQRGLPAQSTPRSRRWGLLVIVGALLIHLGSMYTRGTITCVSGFMMISVLVGGVLYIGGFPMLRRLWFPLAFLAFMVPLPDPLIGQIAFFLKMRAAQASTFTASALGVPVIHEGSDILLAHNRELTVDNVCSGLKSLISLLAFATLFTYACRLRGYKRLILFLSAVPMALLANVLRITTLIIVANAFGTKLASPGGWVHDSMGYVVFAIAFCLMFVEEEFLDVLPGARSGQWITQGPGNDAALGGSI